MSIILLRGYSHSGKDFIGNILTNNYDYHRIAFADSLKKMIAKEFNCSIELLHSQEGKLQICQNDSLKRTYRQLLIDEALRLRNIDSDIFAKYCCNEIHEINEIGHNKIVITDWRYSNELDILKEYFPDYKITTVHIQRLNQKESPVKDISEYQLLSRKSDYVLKNNMDNTIFQEVHNLIQYIHQY